MVKGEKKYIWIILGIIILISLSSEFAQVATEISFPNALLGFVVLILMVLGIRAWIKRAKKVK